MNSVEYQIVEDKKLLITISGEFTIDSATDLPDRSVTEIRSFLPLSSISFDTGQLRKWDSSILIFLGRIHSCCISNNIHFVKESLPEGIVRLLDLSEAVPERKGIRKERESGVSFFATTGDKVIEIFNGVLEFLEFTGAVVTALMRVVTGRYRIRGSLLFPIIRECSTSALPIVSLISSLVGLILAFVGAVQLVMFGAQIYVASLVGIAMIRVMGAVMAGVIMAGRTGAAFAAQLGTMEVNEEIDALKTLGISPIEFLVIPRVLSLSILMPFLCIYADLMGILGGLAVGVFMLDLNAVEYFNMTKESVSLGSFWIGIFQSFVFGVLVAVAGCLRGMQCRRSASAVGEAATSAVVTGIVSIVIATAIITVLCNIIGI